MSDGTGSDITDQTNGTPATAAVEAAKMIYAGDFPSNKLIQATLDSTHDAVEERQREAALDQRGRLLARDAQKILESSKRFLEEKNSDEMVQKLFYHSKEASVEAKQKAERVMNAADSSGESLENLQSQAQDIFYVSKRVIYEVAKSSEFRSLLTDTLSLIKKMFWMDIETEGQRINRETKNSSHLPDYQNRNFNPDPETVFISKANERMKLESSNRGNLNESEKDRLLDQISLVLNRVAAKPEYHKAVNGIITIIDQLQVKTALLKQDPRMENEGEVTEAQRKVWNDLKTLLERWTGEGSLQPVLNNLRKFYRIISNDHRAKSIFQNGSQMMRETFQDPESLNLPQNREKFSVLIDQCRSLMNDQRYSAYWSDVLDQISDLLKSFKEDEASRALGDAISMFVEDMTKDSYGRVSLGAFQDSMTQMKSLFLPVLLKQMEAIPIGKIQKSTPKMDYEVDNVVLSAYDVLPEMIRFNFLTVVNVDMKDMSTDNVRANLRLEVKNVRSHLRDVHFKFVRKQFPKIEDEGIVDLDIQGEGMSMILEWEIVSSEREEENLKFRVKQRSATVDQVVVNIKQAKHPVLDRVGTKLLSAKIRSRVEDEIETNLDYLGRYVADGLNKALSSRTDRSNSTDKERSNSNSLPSSSAQHPNVLSVN